MPEGTTQPGASDLPRSSDNNTEQMLRSVKERIERMERQIAEIERKEEEIRKMLLQLMQGIEQMGLSFQPYHPPTTHDDDRAYG
ncbi:MAG: hypothetical protein QXP70_05935 [Methanomassiliicoccales archaeon]